MLLIKVVFLVNQFYLNSILLPKLFRIFEYKNSKPKAEEKKKREKRREKRSKNRKSGRSA